MIDVMSRYCIVLYCIVLCYQVNDCNMALEESKSVTSDACEDFRVTFCVGGRWRWRWNLRERCECAVVVRQGRQRIAKAATKR